MGRSLDQSGFARYQLNRSRMEWRLGRPDSALACVDRAEWTYRTFFDANPTPLMGTWLAAALDRKGQVLAHLDRLSEAATAFEEAIRLNERFLTPGHPNLPRIVTELAGIRLRQGVQDSAAVAALRGASGLTAYVRWEFSRMTEDEALRYRGTGAAAALNVLLSVAATDPGSRWVPAIWDAVVEDAGLVAAEVTARRRLWSATRDSLLADWARELIVVRAHQGESQANRPGPDSDSLAERARLLEERLATRSAGLRHDLSLHAISGAEVSGALPEHARLVHFVRFLWSGARAPSEDRESIVASRDEPRIGGPASEWYGAFLVAAGGPPRFVPIGSARRIDAELEQWHRQLASGRRLDARALRVGRALRRRLWDPLAVDARTCPLVFVVPAGPLAVLNFATLPGEDGVPLVESAPPIQLLDSPRQLLAPRHPAASGRALIVGGADFDASLPAGPPVPGALPAFRGRSSDCRAPATRTFEPLPASAEEASHVARAWSRREGSTPDVRLGPLATELAVRRQAGGCELVHIATHGYLVPDSCEAAVRAGPLGVADLIGFTMPPGAGERMLHMGLVFAGANATGRSAGDDGWLTAADVAMLDLSGARLVTLSACESGRGDPVDAEGLIGLRWALMEAGARATLTSCHRVSDEHAARWIDHFYSAWLGESLPLPAAAREASRRLRRELRARGQGERPGAWGAFLTAGDWH